MEIINLKYTVAGDHSENILNSMMVRKVKICILGKRPQGHAVPNRLAQDCESGKSLIHNACRKSLLAQCPNCWLLN